MLNQVSQPVGKKAYHTPVVHDYGNIRVITQAVANNPNRALDAGTGNAQKTG